jgi:hypothetical protein
LDKLLVVQYYEVFLVGGDGLACPVKTASDQYLTVYQTVLVVHVCHFVIVRGAGYAQETQSPDIRAVKFTALIV